MKNAAILLVIIYALWACNSSTNSDTNKEETVSDTMMNAHADHKQEMVVEGLTLNNSAKWNGDEATNNNVKNLEEILREFKTSAPPTTSDYVTLSNNLQGGLDKMITECRMKGADHDALHKWLEPLIGKVKKLKQVDNVEAGETATQDIKGHVKVYHQYFN